MGEGFCGVWSGPEVCSRPASWSGLGEEALRDKLERRHFGFDDLSLMICSLFSPRFGWIEALRSQSEFFAGGIK